MNYMKGIWFRILSGIVLLSFGLFSLNSCDDDVCTGVVINYLYFKDEMYKVGEKRIFSHYAGKNRVDNSLIGTTVEYVAGDTVIEGKTCKIIKSEFSSSDSKMKTEELSFIYEELVYDDEWEVPDDYPYSTHGAKVYEYLDGQFVLKYDFTMKSGDGFKFYDKKAKAYIASPNKMKKLEAIRDNPKMFTELHKWRVTFEGTDCVWVECAGANYGDGMIINPDEKGYKFLDSIIGVDGQPRFKYTVFGYKTFFDEESRPCSRVVILDDKGWHF